MMNMTMTRSMSTTRLGVPGAATFVDVIRGRVADQPDQVGNFWLDDELGCLDARDVQQLGNQTGQLARLPNDRLQGAGNLFRFELTGAGVAPQDELSLTAKGRNRCFQLM